MSRDTLRSRLAAGEDASTVFVGSTDDFTAIARSACGLLNSDGGSIFCGVRADGTIIGLPATDPELALDLEIRLKDAVLPVALISARFIEADGAALLLVEVPKGKDGPYVTDGGIWLREGPVTRAADIPALRRLLRIQADTPVRWERRISPSMTDEDLDIDEIRTTVREGVKRRFKFVDPDDNAQVLAQLSAVTSAGYTQGGDVVFSRYPALRHPQARAQLVVFRDDKTGDEFTDNRWLEGPIVRVCNELIAAVEATNTLTSNFDGDAERREDRLAYDPKAIEEGIVNAFVHRDYAAYSGGLRVSIYPSRIEIWNSGRLPDALTPGALRGKHESIPTNPDLAHVFYLRGLMERVGRGTELIVKSSRDRGAPLPVWRDTASGVTLVIYSAAAKSPEADTNLNPRQARLLETLETGESFTLKEFHARFAADVTERQARRDLIELQRAGAIRRRGKGPATIYRVEARR